MELLTRTLCAALLAAFLLVLAATSAEAHHSRGKCKQAGSTIAKNDFGRVYERERSTGNLLYGCLWAENRELLLEVNSEDVYGPDHYGSPILRGRYVAWIYTSEDLSCKADCPPNYDATEEYVNVFDLKKNRGKVARSDPAFDSLRLNGTGDAAWLTLVGDGNRAVNAWKGAQSQVLDTGPIKRFRLRGPTLSWINGDVQHAVTLR